MITFHNIDKNDAKELSRLDEKCFSSPWSEASFSNEASNPLAQYVIAKADEKVVGYAGFWQVVDEGQITNIAVLNEYRRKGIARQMLEILIQKAKERQISVLSLEVRESNFSAISLYEKFEFHKVGLRKDYYKNPTENAVLMDLTIS